MNPVPGYSITTPYKATTTNPGQWSLGFHTGADFGAPTGTKIVSATPGRVVTANSYDKSYGYKVIIRWGSYDVWYCHMPKDSAKVSVGQTVKAGQEIGVVGQTGNATGSHLHMELRLAGSDFTASNFRDPKKAIEYGTKPYGARWFKISFVNHGAAAGVFKKPGAKAFWKERRKKLFDLMANINGDVLVGLECGGGTVWAHIKKAYKNRGYVLATHVKGRAIWVRKGTRIVDKGHFNPPQRTSQKTSWKPAPWIIAEFNGTTAMIVGSHLETSSDSDNLRVQQALHIIKEAEKVAKKHKLDRSRIVHCSDSASDNWVRQRVFNAQGYGDVLETAHKITNAEYKSYNNYKPPRSGPRVDGVYCYSNPKKPRGADGDRPVSKASMRLTMLTDHHPIAAIIMRQQPK